MSLSLPEPRRSPSLSKLSKSICAGSGAPNTPRTTAKRRRGQSEVRRVGRPGLRCAAGIADEPSLNAGAPPMAGSSAWAACSLSTPQPSAQAGLGGRASGHAPRPGAGAENMLPCARTGPKLAELPLMAEGTPISPLDWALCRRAAGQFPGDGGLELACAADGGGSRGGPELATAAFACAPRGLDGPLGAAPGGADITASQAASRPDRLIIDRGRLWPRRVESHRHGGPTMELSCTGPSALHVSCGSSPRRRCSPLSL